MNKINRLWLCALLCGGVCFAEEVDFEAMERDAQQALENKRYRRAAVLYSRLVHATPDQVDYITTLARIEQTRGNLEEARKWAQRSVQIGGQNLSALEILAQLASWQQNWEEARDFFQQLVNLHPDYAPAYLGLGNALNHLGRLQEAKAVADEYEKLVVKP